ncbi:2TM domain-containing protein [Flavobacterium sp. MC2016-06]|uniref:2TM domain-containing protein n=1 Tax=Flavobacterium sp. MC2016-06 TaxID=2676308 RepID=UPI0012BAEFE4|nr:2TM domain-containing protein [Flavobacterium sp. MC2016-06]MBU3861978.1 2TM domain-containing protein [Flavobacterium sp. MC2016-06]
METYFNNDLKEVELRKIARKKVMKLKSFYTHLLIYIAAIVVYLLKEYLGFRLNFFPLKYINGFVIIVWSAFFFVTAIDVFASFKIFGAEWEERKMNSLLEKRKKQKWE